MLLGPRQVEVVRSQLSLEATSSPHLCPIAAKGEWVLDSQTFWLYKCESFRFSLYDPTLCDPMDYNLPGSSVHGILQTRILEWVAIPFSRGSSLPRNGTQVTLNLPHLKFCQFKKKKNMKTAKPICLWTRFGTLISVCCLHCKESVGIFGFDPLEVWLEEVLGEGNRDSHMTECYDAII